MEAQLLHRKRDVHVLLEMSFVGGYNEIRGLLLVALVLGALGWYWFRPELLFVHTSVNETSSIAADSGGDAAHPVWSGTFQSLAHPTTSNAAVYATSDGTYTVRLTNLRTSSGPGVRVQLVAGTHATSDDAIRRGKFVDLRALKGNVGDQNDVVPTEVDLARYHSVTIWCRCGSGNFGATGTSAAAAAHTAAFATGEYL